MCSNQENSQGFFVLKNSTTKIIKVSKFLIWNIPLDIDFANS